jgi:signal transduction histidine kinase
VLNLLTNARDAAAAGPGSVRVLTRNRVLPLDGSPRDCVLIEVRDDGRGMDGTTRARVFDPFFSTRPGGTGLGMALVATLVRHHGGCIALESEPGRGTSVRIYLPAA